MKKKELKEKNEREAVELKAQEERNAILEIQKKQEKMLAAGNCAICGSILYGKASFEIFDTRCCSTACVSVFRRKLAAEAAEKRLMK